MKRSLTGFGLILASLGGGLGCSSEISDADGTGTDPDTPVQVVGPSGEVVCGDLATQSVTPLKKLSTVQYKNTVVDVLNASGLGQLVGEVESLLSSVPADTLGDSFRGLDDRVSLEHVSGYFNVSLAVGDAVASDANLLSAVTGGCGVSAPLTAACVAAFMDGFARRAYRRPLTDAEMAELSALNDGVRSPAEAIRAMLVVVMNSPHFVNHVEIAGTPVGGSEQLLQLSPYEVASRLSYTFWRTAPDDALLGAAADGSLLSQEGFVAQLERVFGDPRTQETIWQFWQEWLKLEKFTGFEATRPAFQALAEGEMFGEAGHDHYADMVAEVRGLTSMFTFEQPSTLSALLTTDVSVTDSEDLARLYGVPAWSGTGAAPLMPAGTRSGLLQRGALLVSNLEQTNPFHRGAFVRRTLLCDDLPQPDPNTLPPGSLDPPPATSEETTRQRYSKKVEGNPLCIGCHSQFADIGYVLESFDALGRFRQLEQVFDEQTGEKLAELPIDTAAVARVTASDEAVVLDAADLNQRIVDSKKVEACLAKNYFEFVTRRPIDPATQDACVREQLASQLDTPEQGLLGAFKGIASYSGFFHRKVGPQ